MDARKILKPEPEPSVVFVSRRDGLVPINFLGRWHNYHTPVILVSICVYAFPSVGRVGL